VEALLQTRVPVVVILFGTSRTFADPPNVLVRS